ncbi:hypothetical protein NDU88_003924 [Pleurodeles waltl]|uniref:Uncharacterized protein n=1 Tax=Pleurodeles waltl TaxID=8319 RepID=A0AAV7SHH6_PLEWA|nr:hypothetical protein NDU88_003924 [Pleurodeles waltl]
MTKIGKRQAVRNTEALRYLNLPPQAEPQLSMTTKVRQIGTQERGAVAYEHTLPQTSDHFLAFTPEYQLVAVWSDRLNHDSAQ